jgi:hypothetical protein
MADKQKPTSGPWKAIARKDCGVFRLYAGDEHLASLSFVDEPTEDANAKLIAAAPDLLAACLTALGDVSNVAIRGRIEAAINKATGA